MTLVAELEALLDPAQMPPRAVRDAINNAIDAVRRGRAPLSWHVELIRQYKGRQNAQNRYGR